MYNTYSSITLLYIAHFKPYVLYLSCKIVLSENNIPIQLPKDSIK